MVLTEGFKDIWDLEYILKVNFSSNYVIMVKLLENAKHKINMLLDKKWQKAPSCECVRTCVHIARVELAGSTNTPEQLFQAQEILPHFVQSGIRHLISQN